MKDFACCGLIMDNMHELLQHFETAHANNETSNTRPSDPPEPSSRAAEATNVASAIQQQALQQNNSGRVQPPHAFQQQPVQQPRTNQFASQLQTIPDMDVVDDMEMDDINDETTPPANNPYPISQTHSPQAQFNQPAHSRGPSLNTNFSQMQNQALRQSTPTTPIAQNARTFGMGGANLHALNTPTLTGNPMQQQFQEMNGYKATPDSSAPGTPDPLDDHMLDGMSSMNMQNNNMFAGQYGNLGFGNYNFNDASMVDLCIDEPAKRLFGSGGGLPPPQNVPFGHQNQQDTHTRLHQGTQYGPESEIARRIREQQKLAGVPDPQLGMMPTDEPKPFRCPVIGCEKAYKNQNGLKYHKSVSSFLDERKCGLLTIASMVIRINDCTTTLMGLFLS